MKFLTDSIDYNYVAKAEKYPVYFNDFREEGGY